MRFPKSPSQSRQSSLSSSAALGSSSVPGKVQSRHGAPKTKDPQKVIQSRLKIVSDVSSGFLRRAKSRKSCTSAPYAEAWASLITFAVAGGLLARCKSRFVSMTQLDTALEKFGEHQGLSKYVLIRALQNCSIEYPAWPTSVRSNYLMTKAATKGWGLEPGSSREPCPIEIAFWIAFGVVSSGLSMFAAAVVISFDTYIRPGKILDLRHRNIIPPPRGVNGRYVEWTLLLHQEGQDPSKTGQYNDSREWIGSLLGNIFVNAPPLVWFSFQFESAWTRIQVQC